ncbi:hypothetical protein Glove_668g38 [Diversispora epigaea]|uniref:Uncharacterized protein n=1 Tax=Diversispora epigaea TaxID=1348612 RepID=A0A397G7N0_9GLOM|nr:hypothetical protein Glove_668g38 [Diversispora epigaea]
MCLQDEGKQLSTDTVTDDDLILGTKISPIPLRSTKAKGCKDRVKGIIESDRSKVQEESVLPIFKSLIIHMVFHHELQLLHQEGNIFYKYALTVKLAIRLWSLLVD